MYLSDQDSGFEKVARSSDDRIAVIDKIADAWQVIDWVNEDEARRLIREGLVTLLSTKKRIRALKWLHGSGERISYTPSQPRATKYSHNHETEATCRRCKLRCESGLCPKCGWRDPDGNPEKVWTLIRLPKHSRKVFHDVVASCNKSCPLAGISELERREILAACVDELSAKHAQVLKLRYQYAMRFTDIAKELRVTAEAVRTMHSRALPLLRAEFEKRGIREFAHV